MEDNSTCIDIGRYNINEEKLKAKFAPKVPLTIPVTPPKPVSKKMTVLLSHEDRKFKLPSIPPNASSNGELPEAIDSMHSEEPVEPFQVTSQSYSLEEFYEKHDFPQIVRVVHGYFGTREEDIMSLGQELLFFFVKTSQVIVASSHQSERHYYISFTSSLWFVPHYESANDTTTDSNENCQQYRTVADLLKRKGDIPKVVKVGKTYNGKSPQSSVVAGELIFPQKITVLQTIINRKRVLECLNNKKKLLRLELACEGNFSIQPIDIKMHIAEFVQYFSTFPISVRVISNHKGSNASFSLSTGTVLILKELKTLQSYIYSTDLFGKKNYPLMEMPMTIPITIQCIEYPYLDIKPIYNAIRYTYENFKPSMVKRKIFCSQNGLYEEVQNDDGTTHIYDLEKPSRIYERISDKFRSAKDINHPYPAPVKKPPSFMVAPPIPPPRRTGDLSVTAKKSRDISKCHPVSLTNTNKRKLSAPISPVGAGSYANINSSTEFSVAQKPIPEFKGNSVVSHVATTNPHPNMLSSLPSSNATAIRSGKEENLAYLKTLNLNSILQLLDSMNLGEHKESFKDEKIDGEIMVHLDRADLADLGVSRRIQQIRLLQLIDGSVSAKKFTPGGKIAS